MVAVVTAGILLIIAMSIGGIALKEQILSTSNKESQVAFYAADTGMECALYWDQVKGVFALDVNGNQSSLVNSVKCNNSAITLTFDKTSSTLYDYRFKISGIPVGSDGATTCAVVEVDKNTAYVDPVKGGAARIKTDIYSYGYSTCDASLNRLERGIEGHY